MTAQKRKYRSGSLSLEKIDLLEKIGIEWGKPVNKNGTSILPNANITAGRKEVR